MASNTKASSFNMSKADMKDYVSDFIVHVPNSSFFHNENNGVTMLVTQEFINSNVMQVTTAICSPDEKKYREHVGEYLCVEAYLNGKYINIPRGTIFGFIESFGIPTF